MEHPNVPAVRQSVTITSRVIQTINTENASTCLVVLVYITKEGSLVLCYTCNFKVSRGLNQFFKYETSEIKKQILFGGSVFRAYSEENAIVLQDSQLYLLSRTFATIYAYLCAFSR